MDKKEKSKGQNNIFLVLLIVLMTVAVVVAIAGAIAGNLSETEPKTKAVSSDTAADTSALRESKPKTAEEKETEKDTADSAKDDTPDDTGEEQNEDKEDAFAPENTLPQFIAPADGKVLKAHSSEVPVFSMTMEDYRTHSGVDIYADPQSTVIAAADGTIQEIWSDPMMGSCLSIAHSGGALTVYKNLSDEFPEGTEPGKEVRAGDVIATVGDSALEEISEESHLHFEMSVDGVPVDPALYVKFMNEETYTE